MPPCKVTIFFEICNTELSGYLRLQLYNKHPEYVQEYTTVKISQLSNYCYKKAGVKTE